MELKPARRPPINEWSTRIVKPSDMSCAWEHALADNYGKWQLSSPVASGFSASIRNRDFNGLKVVECVCDPCSGQRTSQLIKRDTTAFIGIQITRSGSERFHLGNDVIHVGVGDLVIWASDQPTDFAVTATLSKVSLVLPWADVQERLPRGAGFKGTVIDSRSGIGAVLFSHIDSLAHQLDLLGEDDQAAVRRATLELLVAAMSCKTAVPERNLSLRYIRHLQDYILANLQDETLTPTKIAADNNMSPRYVHLLFAQINVSVSSWIRDQRLERCREDLGDRKHRHMGISEIAYSWGFSDATHFSRVFKQKYDVNPRQFRDLQLKT